MSQRTIIRVRGHRAHVLLPGRRQAIMRASQISRNPASILDRLTGAELEQLAVIAAAKSESLSPASVTTYEGVSARMAQFGPFQLIYTLVSNQGTDDEFCILDVLDNHATQARQDNTDGTPTVDHVLLPKIPAIMQEQIDSLIERSKRGELSESEERKLDELLDYLDDLTIKELDRLVRSQKSGQRP